MSHGNYRVKKKKIEYKIAAFHYSEMTKIGKTFFKKSLFGFTKEFRIV